MPGKPNHLRYFRVLRNMTQEEVAQKLDTNVRNIRRWELGESSMDVYMALKISHILGVSVEDIFENFEKF